MKVVKQILFGFVLIVGMSIAASAQKDDQKKPPPKGNPPVVTPREKPPRENPPKGDDRPKKPGMAFALKAADTNGDLA